MIESIIDCYCNTTTRDKLIFPSTITRILTHIQVSIPPFPHFYVMGAISKEFIWHSVAQLAAKQPYVEPTDAAPANLATPSSWPSSSSAPSSLSRVAVSLANIIEWFQHMRADFGSHLNHLSKELC